MQADTKIACFPHLGEYYVPLKILIERCLGYKVVKCPPTTKKTVETGSKNSPDTVCTPFKIILGNFIESLEQGVNTLIMPGFGCRLGFYDILHKQILSDLSYNFEMMTLFEYTANKNRLYRSLKEKNPDLSDEQFNTVLDTVVKVVTDMDELGDYMRRNMAFELKKGEFEKTYNLYLYEIQDAQNAKTASDIGEKYRNLLHSIKINKPQNPMKIGLIGDLYSVMEPHGNCEIEKWLANNRIEIIRPITLTYLANTLFNVNALIEKSEGYANYNMGGNANNTVALALEMAKDGIDGIIHMKAATCSPEITAMTVLQNIARDYNIPIIYLTFDTETSETGLHTRLEAFCDMLIMKGA